MTNSKDDDLASLALRAVDFSQETREYIEANMSMYMKTSVSEVYAVMMSAVIQEALGMLVSVPGQIRFVHHGQLTKLLFVRYKRMRFVLVRSSSAAAFEIVRIQVLH
jgi:hypothetical protein